MPNPYFAGTPYTKSVNILGVSNTALTSAGVASGTKSTLRTAAARERIESVLVKATQDTTPGRIMFWRLIAGTYYFLGHLAVDAAAISDTVAPFEQVWVPGTETILESGEGLVATNYNSETLDAHTSYGIVA